MEYYDPMEMKCPWCRRPSRPGFGGPPPPPPPPSPPRPGYGPGPGRFVWSAAASRFRPAATSPAARPGPRWSKQAPPLHARIRPFEAEEVWQAPSPEQSPAPQSQDSLFQEDEPSTPLTRYYEDDYETERDLERMKNLYPEISKELFPWIEDVCDQMEYEGSLMYDESPDPEPGPPPDFPDLRAGEGTVPAPGRGGQR